MGRGGGGGPPLHFSEGLYFFLRRLPLFISPDIEILGQLLHINGSKPPLSSIFQSLINIFKKLSVMKRLFTYFPSNNNMILHFIKT